MSDKRTRRANGDGSIKSRETKTKGLVWDVQVSLKDRNTGLTRRVTKRGFATQKAAMDWRTKKVRESNLKLYVKPTAITLTKLVRTYIDEHSRLAPSTRVKYERDLSLHISTLKARVEAIGPRELQAFGAGGPGPTSRVGSIQLIKAAVRWASDPDVGLLPYNHLVGRRVRVPKGGGKATAIPIGDLRKIVAAAAEEQSRLAWLLASHAGPRKGEITGFNWGDFDFARSRVWIGHIGSPESMGFERVERTKGEGRWVPLPKQLSRDFQKLMLARGAGAGDAVFIMVHGPRKGQRWGLVAAHRYWVRDMKLAGVAGYHVHELRHTFATIALESGKPVQTVSKLLGHKHVATTVNIYSHVIAGSEERVADAVAANLGILENPIASKAASKDGVIPLLPRDSAAE